MGTVLLADAARASGDEGVLVQATAHAEATVQMRSALNMVASSPEWTLANHWTAARVHGSGRPFKLVAKAFHRVEFRAYQKGS